MSSQFAMILERINGGPHGRSAGGATQPVCDAWKEASDQDGKLLINAILGFEIVNERKARADDETAVLAVREELKAGMKKAE